MLTLRRILCLLALSAAGIPFSPRLPAGGGEVPAQGMLNPFFTFDNGLSGEDLSTPRARAALLADLGYAGIAYGGFGQLPELLEALDERSLELFSIYTGVQLDGDGPRYDPALAGALKLLRGRRTILWIYVRSGEHRP
ncbi:MAG: hypothetical protein JXA90_06280, partial [Planctomycetes bacterium]|nr:hypothetical protein [Planctomycetota bacterium]